MPHTRAPLRTEDVHRMETEHALIAKLADSVGLRLAAWIAAADSTAANIAARPMATETLISEIEALAELVGDHLSAEEERVIPVINQNLTDAQWRALTERGRSFLNGRRMWFGLAFAGMTLEACTPDERRRFLAGMPKPQRLLVRLFVRPAALAYRARLERTSG